MLFAFSTSSSNATMPVTLKTVTQDIGVNPKIASFTIPLGATINMDGTAIMQGVATIFIANAYNIDLTTLDYLNGYTYCNNGFNWYCWSSGCWFNYVSDGLGSSWPYQQKVLLLF